MAIFAALAAALFYSLASVLQQWEAERQPAEQALKVSLLTRLARRPVWVAGLLFDISGFALQWVALSHGSLVVVQPVLLTGLLFALPMKAKLSSYHFSGSDWSGALLTTVGLAVFLAVSQPQPGNSNVSAFTWAMLFGGAAVVILPLVGFGYRRGPRWRAMSYGAGGGIVYGLCAALTKTCSGLLSTGVSHLFSSWQPYVLALAGITGMVLAQSAFQAGPLDVSLPTLSAADPVVSVIVGAVAFGEAIRGGVVAHTLEVISFSAVVAGIFILGHTEAAKAAEHRHARQLGGDPRAVA